MKVWLISEDDQDLKDFRSLLRDVPAVGFMTVEDAFYMNPPQGLDAIFLTLPAAERWSPDFKSTQAQILKTSEQDQTRGWPPFIVTGVNLTPQDPRDPPSQLRLLLYRVLPAVRDFNNKHQHTIRNLGFWAMDLTRCASTTQAAEFLRELLTESQEAI